MHNWEITRLSGGYQNDFDNYPREGLFRSPAREPTQPEWRFPHPYQVNQPTPTRAHRRFSLTLLDEEGVTP